MSWHPLLVLDHRLITARSPPGRSRQTIELVFENWLLPRNTARSSDRPQGLTAVAEGRPSPGGGPLGDEGPWGSTSRARGSRSKQGRTGPGAARRRGPLLPGKPPTAIRIGSRRLPRRFRFQGRRCAIHGHRRTIHGRPGPRRPPFGTRAGPAGPASTTGACTCSLPDRAARWPTLSGMPQPQPGTGSVRALRFRTETGRGRAASTLRRRPGREIRPSSAPTAGIRPPGVRSAASRRPTPPQRRRTAVVPRRETLSAWPRTRARRPRCPAPRPHRCCRPAPRRATGSR